MAFTTVSAAEAATSEADLTPAEVWAWSEIAQGHRVDFNSPCGALDPRKEDDPGWSDPGGCRTLRGGFLARLFFEPHFHDAMTLRGVEIHGAKIDGDVELTHMKIDRPLQVERNWFTGKISLRYANAASLIDFGGSLVSGAFDAFGFRSETDLSLAQTVLKGGLDLAGASMAGTGSINLTSASVVGNVTLLGAEIGGQVLMGGASVAGTFDADGLHVGQILIMRSEGQNKASFNEVNLRGARIDGQIDMTGASVAGLLDADGARVGQYLLMKEGNFKEVVLRGAKIDVQIDLAGASVVGLLDADGAHVGRILSMSKARFEDVDLLGAKIDGQIDMTGASVAGKLDAGGAHVGQDLLISSEGVNKASFNEMVLLGATVEGQIDMRGASVAGKLDANGVHVGQSLLMRSEGENKASFTDIDLTLAKIDGGFDLTGASVDGTLTAFAIKVDGPLFMYSEREAGKEALSSFRDVDLRSATVVGDLNVDGAVFLGNVLASGAQISGDLSMRNVYSLRPIDMSFLQVHGNLDLGGADIEPLDLRGASISGEFRVGDKSSTVEWLPGVERAPLDLRNAHVGNLADNNQSWPASMLLDGFAFARLGGFQGESGDEMVGRGADWWARNFAERDDFHPAPYEQLAAAFAAAGERDAADDIRYLEQARSDQSISWWNPTYLLWRWLFRWGAGYGVGEYMFRALYCAIGLAVIGAVVLHRWVPEATKNGRLWCFGASVNRLLPVIELNKEFKDFFDDPGVNKFTARQKIFFTLLAALGWALGLIVIAAMATITHGA